MPYYFAYGSNMNPARMQARGLVVEAAMAAHLAGFELCFNKRAHDHPGRAYANIRHQAGAVVEGVLYRLACEQEILKLDVFEGTPIYYSRERMAVQTARGAIAAWIYIANPAWRSEGLAPSSTYLAHLLAGREHLSADYWAALAATVSLPD
jgi:gamma-glutamylcyclotransferase (GGCT)/AIG2-like uncharacterized protein YtfP